jgi:protein-S-isoprenylcysteine O-methyltransferase Ste14
VAAALLGLAGFLVLFGVEPAQLRGRGALARVLLVAGRAVVVAGHLLALALSPLLPVSAALRVAGGILATTGLLLLLQSLVFELPRSGAPPLLVTTGTYALVRHPGVLWFAVWMAGLAAASGARDLAVAGPLWFAANAAYAWVEDRVTFPKLFGPAYRAYGAEVPMFVPSAASLRRFARTFRLLRPGSSSGSDGGGR